ncbi:stAR-related lipid transfer protein 8 isoform X1 [Oncorhynchus nerka]|uniref:stAR-related lipid transfer protein 8 isoform X1 n=2 Tax=Oncorhynchus nerka TaxID=8023 RepID=UPI0011308112|nr:stAR-related lipid transfer protein 8 isoform X1 [Oncorhynchus nerka]
MAFFSCLYSLFGRAKVMSSSWGYKRAELEAKEACNWLRAAGFPQYAQLYEAGQFPLDISSVKKDHGFLDQDSLKSLCRRLSTLNKCASMRLEVHFQCKQSEDSEEDDLCAISDRWAFQRESKTWSRLRTLSPHVSTTLHPLRASASSESILSDFSNLEVTSTHSSSSLSVKSDRGTTSSNPSSQVTSTAEPYTLTSHHDSHGSHSPNGSACEDQPVSPKDLLTVPVSREKTKRCSNTFLKRMESFKKKDKEREVTDGQAVTSPLQFPLTPGSLHCTSNESLPGLKNNTTEKSSVNYSRKAHTICRTGRRSPVVDRANAKSSWLYLEDYDMAGWKGAKQVIQKSGYKNGLDCLVHLPMDHKPGTFPKSLSIESLCTTSTSHELREWQMEDVNLSLGSSHESQEFNMFPIRRNSCSSVGSIYDNVNEASGSSDELREKVFEHLDDILQHVHGLQQNIDQWSKKVCQELSDKHEEEQDTDETRETTFSSSLHFEEQSMSDVGTMASDYDSTGNSLNEVEDVETRERRDSGVGASLTRPSRKLRWHSFQNSHRPSLTSASQEINRQSAAQLNLLQKFSLLRLTAIMEKYCELNKHGWSWSIPKFMKRSKVPDYRDKQVFGVPPIINVQRSGQPLPQSIQQAMRYLRSQCLEKVGIFRKSGVKSRIQTLRQLNENSPDHVRYQGQSAYDVADLLKQYFRDLPEPVLTTKLTETFLQIYQCVPKDMRLQAAQAAVILLPDENREVLQTLLYFLSDIASAEENQMTAGNLAVCLAPSILHLNISKKEGTSPRLIHRRGAGGKPDHKDLSENMAATQGLSHMIVECKKLFQIPHEMMLQSRNSYVAADAQPLPLHGLGLNMKGEPVDYRAYLEDNIQALLRESTEKSKGWHSALGPENTELTYKKVGDGHPIRLWKVTTEIEAPPQTVLQRVLRERHLWDDDLLHSRVIEALENNTEVYHYVTDSMAPHPRRDFVVLRRWCSDLPQGLCLLVSSSVDHDNVHLEAGLRAVLLTSRVLIEPSGMGRSRLTHYCRADVRGRSPEWYNKVFGHLCAVEVARIRGSFPVLTVKGTETKL